MLFSGGLHPFLKCPSPKLSPLNHKHVATGGTRPVHTHRQLLSRLEDDEINLNDTMKDCKRRTIWNKNVLLTPKIYAFKLKRILMSSLKVPYYAKPTTATAAQWLQHDRLMCVCMQVSVCPWCVCIRHHVTECAFKLGYHNDAIGIQPSRVTGVSRRPAWTEPKHRQAGVEPRTRYPPEMKEAGTFCKIAQGVSPQQAIVQAPSPTPWNGDGTSPFSC